jgi:hypothetical protein
MSGRTRSTVVVGTCGAVWLILLGASASPEVPHLPTVTVTWAGIQTGAVRTLPKHPRRVAEVTIRNTTGNSEFWSAQAVVFLGNFGPTAARRVLGQEGGAPTEVGAILLSRLSVAPRTTRSIPIRWPGELISMRASKALDFTVVIIVKNLPTGVPLSLVAQSVRLVKSSRRPR